MIVEVSAGIFLLCGTTLCVTAVVGLFRLPDVYARMHAAAKPATLGITLCLIGASISASKIELAVKFLLAALFQLATAPVSAHLLGRAAHEAGEEQSSATVIDELGSE